MTDKAHQALAVDIITPMGVIDEGHAGFVAATGAQGELGILPRHASLVSRLGTGQVRVHREGLTSGKRDYYAIRGGILQVESDHLTLLVPQAVAGKDVDEDEVKTELASTVEALAHPESDEQFEELLDQRKWCEARLSAVRKTKE